MTSSVRLARVSQLVPSAVLLASFAALWLALLAAPSSLGSIDLAAVGDAHRFAVEPFVEKARELTLLGGTHWLLGLTAASACLLALGRYRREALALALAVASTEALVALVKHVMVRPRPPAIDAVDHAAGYSFPSGHAAASVALFASVAFLLSRGQSLGVRIAVWSATGLLLAGIGLSRVYLGVHYPSDVAAGWLLAGALTTASWALVCGGGSVRFSLRDAARALRR